MGPADVDETPGFDGSREAKSEMGPVGLVPAESSAQVSGGAEVDDSIVDANLVDAGAGSHREREGIVKRSVHAILKHAFPRTPQPRFEIHQLPVHSHAVCFS